MLAEGGPAFGEPELGAGVAVVVHEGEVFGAGDQAGGEGEWGEVDGVAGGFVVEGEVIRGRRGRVEKPIWVRPGAKATQSRGGAMASVAEVGGRKVGGVEGVGEESVLDVGGDEFLVLLLVVEAEDDAAGGFGDGDRWTRGGGRWWVSTWVR